jgi:hypothetical protein
MEEESCQEQEKVEWHKNGDISGRQGRTWPLTVSLEPSEKGASINTLHTLIKGPEDKTTAK